LVQTGVIKHGKTAETEVRKFLRSLAVAGIVKFAKKGVVIRNEYNKIIVFEPEVDADRQNVIADVIGNIVNSGRDWQQPDWDAEFAKISKPVADTKPNNNGQNKAA